MTAPGPLVTFVSDVEYKSSAESFDNSIAAPLETFNVDTASGESKPMPANACMNMPMISESFEGSYVAQMPENDACMSMPMMTDGETQSNPQSFVAEQTPSNALASMPLISDGQSTCVTFPVSASDTATNAEDDTLPLSKCPNDASKKWASSVTTKSENPFVQIVDAGKISRGVDHNDSYQFGDFTRGLSAKMFGK